ncbi:MAG: hypothetical protein Q8R32_01025 [bacterium]|nr:hypothetical protein [bacterium]
MPFLDSATKVVRLLSAVVWLGVGILTFWITWKTFQEFQPFLTSLNETAAQLGSTPAGPAAPSGGSSFPDLQELLRASSGIRGSR